MGYCEQSHLRKADEETSVVIGKVVVTKNPCLHPRDIKVLEAIYEPFVKSLSKCMKHYLHKLSNLQRDTLFLEISHLGNTSHMLAVPKLSKAFAFQFGQLGPDLMKIHNIR